MSRFTVYWRFRASFGPLSCPNFLQRLDKVNYTLLQWSVRQLQYILASAVVNFIDVFRRIIRKVFGRQHVLEVREVISDNVGNLLGREVPFCDEETLASRLRNLDGIDVRLSKVSHVRPYVWSTGWKLVFRFALDHVSYPLIRCVERVERVQVVDDRPKDKRWAEGRDGEVWLLLLDKLPRNLFRQSFARTVGSRMVFMYFLNGYRVPNLFVVKLLVALGVDDGSKG